MPEDYYGKDAGPSANDDSPSDMADTPDKGDEGMEETALVPRSLFPKDKEKKPGDKCMFEIVHVYDDEVEIKYVPHDEGKEKSASDEELGDPFAGKT